ncbi:MAG: lysophospholipid acyltransferase family protein [bacterium]
MTVPDASRKIKTRKRGNALGFWFFKASMRWVGLRGAYGLLAFVGLHYLLFDRAAVRATLAYVRRRFPEHGWGRQRWDVYRLFISQGVTLIDRGYLLQGGPGMRSRLTGMDKIADLLATGQGFVLLMAHLGNWQVVMTALTKFNRKVYLVMRPEDNPAVAETLKISHDSGNISIISPEGALGGVVEIMEALKSGGIVSIMGDRSYSFSAVDVQFLGDQARFSCGAFHIAAMARCPVVALLAAKTAVYDYEVNVAGVFHPLYHGRAKKQEQLRDWVQTFARVMEEYVRQYPYQCFLFYDIWSEAGKPAS